MSRGEPFANVLATTQLSISLRKSAGRIARTKEVPHVQAGGVGDPSQAARCDACDSECDAVGIAQFVGADFQQTDQGLIDVAEAEKAEIVGWYGGVLEGQISQSFRGSQVSRFQRDPLNGQILAISKP